MTSYAKMCKGCNNLDLSQSMQAISMNLSTIVTEYKFSLWRCSFHCMLWLMLVHLHMPLIHLLH